MLSSYLKLTRKSFSTKSALNKSKFIIQEQEILEKFVKGSGPGGQKINKCRHCVQLTHIPTSIHVSCQDTRSLTSNRKIARKLLTEKVEHLKNGVESKKGRRISKVQKKKARNKRRSKLQSNPDSETTTTAANSKKFKINDAPRIRVIGGGITAAAFVDRILELLPNADILVSEMGRGMGGRCATRDTGAMKFSHGCPAFDIRTSEFQSIVDDWTKEKIVEVWHPLRLGIINTETMKSTDIPSDQHTLYQLSSRFCKHLMTDNVPFQSNTLINQMEYSNEHSKWKFNDESIEHDWLIVTSPVVAHSKRWSNSFGKDTDAPLRKALANNMDHVSYHQKSMLNDINEIESKSIISLLTVFKGETAQRLAKSFPYEMAHVQNSSVIEKIVCEGMTSDGLFPLVVHSTETYSNEIGRIRGSGSSISKVGKEGVPSSNQKQQQVEDTMREELLKCLTLWIDEVNDIDFSDEKEIDYSAVHSWSAAFPIKNESSMLKDHLSLHIPSSNLILCGDYFGKDVGRVETAILSGRDAAETILRN